MTASTLIHTHLRANVVRCVGVFADWDEEAFGCSSWSAGFGSEVTCISRGSGEASNRLPRRPDSWGSFNFGTGAGPFAVGGGIQPFVSLDPFGFRGARGSNQTGDSEEGSLP